jgi:hypothetical protein
MNEDLSDMLTSSDKGASQATGVLSRLFRQILKDRNTSMQQWTNLMLRYLDDPNNNIPRNGKDRSSARGNLNKELKRKRMTWKVFRKAMKFLAPKWIRFEVHAGWHDPTSPVSIHTINLDIYNTSVDDDESDEDTDTPAGHYTPSMQVQQVPQFKSMDRFFHQPALQKANEPATSKKTSPSRKAVTPAKPRYTRLPTNDKPNYKKGI